MNNQIDKKLKRDEGRRRAALHFAEDFVMGLREMEGLYATDIRKLQHLSHTHFAHPLNEAMLTGLVVFFKAGRVHKDNRYIFELASLVCDILDDSLDIKRR